MESRRVRQLFLDFFASKGHTIVPSAPMVIKDDPTLMFNNAGMNPFKDIFLGNSPILQPRVADTQKCLRVSGKHNDLEEVGVDTYHHTMFEMLGNWSFGDYFKREAIDWAWELLTDRYGLEKDRLYVTVFGGDAGDGLEEDHEARQLWLAHVPEDRILPGSKKDNFWEMGETGPCGPCSEIHVDLRTEAERAAEPGRDWVNRDHPQVVEIWNLVFMQFNRMADGSLVPLPNAHIDTGMGFERLCMALQGKRSNYDTDVFTPMLARIAALSGVTYTAGTGKSDVAFRVIADHIRAVSFSIADGQLPSNAGAGYVIRRILRRAIRYGHSFLGLQEPFMHRLVGTLADQMGDAFPELHAQRTLIERVILEEEEAFLRTLSKGIDLLSDRLAKLPAGGTLPGASVFELYDTFGFPADLTALVASEGGYAIDSEGFEAELARAKERSRAAGKVKTDDWVEVRASGASEPFVGYDCLESDAHIVRYRRVEARGKVLFQIALDATPFYPEGGGQIGDTGYLWDGKERTAVLDTKRENNLIVHFTESVPEAPETPLRAVVFADGRRDTEKNHSATHLLHEALREVLGTHVEQRGSLVRADALRFDFSHFSKPTEAELLAVEDRVNERIQANLALDERRAIPLEEARAEGAMMLFGEKYGDRVRMIRFGTSKELCGGTHVPATGAIGLFRIVSEGAVAAGIRRIEATTGMGALRRARADEATLENVRTLLKSPQDVVRATEDLLARHAALSRELEVLKREQAQHVKAALVGSLEQRGGVHLLVAEVDLDAAAVKDLAFQLRAEHAPFLGVIGTRSEGKVALTVALSDDLVRERGLNATAIVKELSAHIQGGGGGQPFFATAGGKKPEGLEAALQHARGLL
jgi:alanyl-tRNA synthetase